MASDWNDKGWYGMSYKHNAERFNVSHSVIFRLKQHVNQTGSVNERQRTGRPMKMTPREDRLLTRLPKQQHSALQARSKADGLSMGALADNIHLYNARFRARRTIQRSLLTKRHKTARLQWASDHMGYKVRSWQRVHWSDESRFLLNPVEGCVRVWRQEHIMGTTAFGGGGVIVYGCFSLNCKVDFDGTLTGQKYRDEILRPLVVPHFDGHPLVNRPILMDDIARPHRVRIVQDYLQQDAIELLLWPAVSPDRKPIENFWDYL